MATRSTVPTIRAQLVSLLASRPGLAGVQVAYSHPGEAVEDESVYLGESRGTAEIATVRAARKSRQERYMLDLWVEVNRDGPDAQTATERAWTLAGEVEDLLADDPSLGQPQPFWAVLAEEDQQTYVDDARRGYVVRLRLGVECEARLT